MFAIPAADVFVSRTPLQWSEVILFFRNMEWNFVYEIQGNLGIRADSFSLILHLIASYFSSSFQLQVYFILPVSQSFAGKPAAELQFLY